MARGSKIVLNRAALDDVTLALADGMNAVGMEILQSTKPPDSPFPPYPEGEGLPKQGGVLAYVNGKKVAGYGQDGKQPRAPRAAKVSRSQGAVVIVGYGFPGRFNEEGTVKMRSQPFLSPAAAEVLPRTVEIMEPVVRPALPKAGPL